MKHRTHREMLSAERSSSKNELQSRNNIPDEKVLRSHSAQIIRVYWESVILY